MIKNVAEFVLKTMQTRKQCTSIFKVLKQKTGNPDSQFSEIIFQNETTKNLFQKFNVLRCFYNVNMVNSYNFKKLTTSHKYNKNYTNKYRCAK